MAVEQEEFFDLVDASDRVIGRMSRAEVHLTKALHRAVHIMVFDTEGRLYLQKRSMRKDMLPGLWTSSCSGHVDSGEDYDCAAVRELEEELSIRVTDPHQLEFLFKQAACEATGFEFVQVYRLHWPHAVIADEFEVSALLRLDVPEVENRLSRNPEDFTPCFNLLWQRCREILQMAGKKTAGTVVKPTSPP